MINRFERFSFAIAEIYRHWHKIASDEMEKYDLKGPYAVYLTTMYRYPEGITATQLSELCSKDKADVSRAMAIMEKKGLVKKESINQNLYRALIRLTDQGIEAAELVRQRAGVAVEKAGSGISDENRAIFYEVLEHIAVNLQTISAEGLPQG